MIFPATGCRPNDCRSSNTPGATSAEACSSGPSRELCLLPPVFLDYHLNDSRDTVT